MTAITGAPRRPRIRRLEDRLLLSATPEAIVADLPDAQLINEDFTFGVSFDNVADPAEPDATGYGPFVDLTVGPGVTVTGAAYLDRSLPLRAVATWDGAGWVDAAGAPVTAHPFDPTGAALALPQGGEIGQSWLLAALPFGSYGPEQPALPLRFTATLTEAEGARPGEPVEVTARGGFRFGLDPLDNPRLDPPVQQGAAFADSVTPVVVRIAKTVALPEGETAQGPNFAFDYVLSVDVASGVTVTDLRVTDALPQNLFFLGAASSVAPDAAIAPGLGAPQGLPGLDTVAEARFDYAAVTGAPGADVVIRLTAFAPRLDAAGAPLIDPLAPVAAQALNTARLEALYEGDPVDGALSGPLEAAATATIRPFTVQKSVSVVGGGAPVAGALLRFEVAVDVSDDQALDALTLADLLDDGLELDAAAPLLTLTQDGVTRSTALRPAVNPGEEAEFAASVLPAGDPDAYRQRVAFFLSQAARNLGLSGTFAGDLASDGALQGPTTLSLAYFARVTEAYREPGRGPVVLNDALANRVAGEALSAASGAPAEGDGSTAGVTLSPPRPDKTVFAVNGVEGAPASVAPGDLVTYRLTIALDALDARALVIEDFLPLPLFGVGADLGFIGFTDADNRLPLPGEILRGPGDTLSGALGPAGLPTVSTDAAANSLRVAFGDFSQDAPGGGTIDLLYTVRVADRPFADGLQIVNQAVFTSGDSRSDLARTDVRLGEILLRQPVLTLTKGVVATDATGAPGAPAALTPTQTGPAGLSFAFRQPPGQPGFTVAAPLTLAQLTAAPVNSDLSGVDAGDTVKFALVIANAGGQDAFDLVIRDLLPAVDVTGDGVPDPGAGFRLPTNPADLRLDVRFGDGTAIAFDGSAAPAPLTWSGDLFGAGIRIADAAGAGALGPDGRDDGRNIVIVTYELVAEDGFRPATTAVNAAEIASFAAVEGGADFTEGVEGAFADAARVAGQGVSIVKRLISTSESFTPGDRPNIPGGNGAAIGERVTYQMEVRVPEGQTNVVIRDLLPLGVRLFTGAGFPGGDGAPRLLTSFTDVTGAAQSFDGVIAQSPGGPSLSNGALLGFTQPSGREFVITLDRVAAAAGPGTGAGDTTFAIRYTGILIDLRQSSGAPVHDAGDQLFNVATLDTATTEPTAPARARFVVQEPALGLVKSFSPAVVEGGPGGATTMTLQVTNAAGPISSPAFGLVLTDPGLTKTLVSAIEATRLIGSTPALQGRINAGGLAVTIGETADAFLITATGAPDFFIAPGETLQLQFDLRVNPQAVAGDSLLNVATIPAGGYSSLPGSPQVERFYGPVSAQATLLAARPELFKDIVATSLGNDIDPDVAVGELVTYALRLDLPQGRTLGASLLDDLRAANVGALAGLLEIVSVDAVRVGAALVLADRPGGLGVGDVVTTDSDGDGRLDRLALDIGDILNDDAAPPLAGAESIVVEFTARVLNVAAAREGATHVNRASFESDLPGRPGAVTGQATATLTVIEPRLAVAKTSDAPAAGVDAGDAVTFTLRIDSDAARGSGVAWDVTLVDRLSAALELDPTSITVSGGATAPGLRALTLADVSAVQLGGVWVLTVGAAGGGDGVDLGPGGSATITYTARVREAIREGDLVSNAAELTYRSLPFADPADGSDPAVPPGGDPADAQRRDGSDVAFAAFDPADPPRDDPAILNNYADLARLDLQVRAPGPIEKTADRAVATIGERIGYTLVIPVIEGATAEPTLVDDLPPGLGFVLTGATVADSVTATDAAGAPIPILEARIEATAAGERLVLRLADIITPGDGLGGDAIRISYAARPLNLDAVRDGGLLTNTATFTSRPSDPAAPPLARADDATVAVVEPSLALTKTVAAIGAPDAGDLVTYTLTVTHTAASRAGAFELTLDDILPADLTVTGPVTATRDGEDVSALFLALGDRVVTAPGADLDLALGQTLTIVYRAALGDRIGPAQSPTNAAALRWTSLDGAVEGERSGEGPVPPNDYRADAAAAFVTDDRLTVDKSVAGGGAAFAIGQPITFFLDIDVLEGALRDLRVSDRLGPGLLADPSSLRVVANGFGGATPAIEGLTLTVDPATGAQSLTFTLDNTPAEAGSLLVNPGDNLRANDVIRIAYEARFANLPDLRDGARRDNAVAVTAEDAGPDDDAASVDVVEPRVSVDKRVVSPPGPVDAGDIVLFEVVLTATGPVTAFDVSFADALPPALIPTGALTAVDGAGAPVAGFSVVGSEIRGAGFDIAPGGRVTVTYAARVADAVRPEALIENLARIAWTSQPGAAPGERDGSDGEGPDDATLNNYAASDAAAIAVGAFPITLSKTLAASALPGTAGAEVAVGEIVTFALRVGVAEGTTPGLRIEDALPQGLRYLAGSARVVPGAPGGSTGFDPALVVYDAAANRLIAPLGDVVNPGDNDPSNDVVTLFYDAVVTNDPAAVTQGATLVNVATAVTATAQTAGAEAALQVVEPTLLLTKSALTPLVGVGGRADYAVTVAHDAGSAADAHDLIIADPFADGRLRLDPASLVARVLGGAAPVPVAVTPEGAGFRVALDRLALGETLEILFSAVASALPQDNGATVPNAATLVWDGVPGALDPDEQRLYAAEAGAAVAIVGPDLRVEKTADAAFVRPGDGLVYTVVVQNRGAPGVDFGAAETATAVTLTDALPQGVTLVSAAVDGAPATPVFGPDGRTFTLALGPLAADAFLTVTLVTRVDAAAPAATDALVNTARADMPQIDPTPEDNVDDASVGLIATPDLTIAKTNPFETLVGGQVTPFTITIRNVGDRIASGVVVADLVDMAVFDFVSASDGGVFDPATGAALWTLDRLSPDDGPVTLTLTLQVRPFLPPTVTDTVNLAEVSDDGRGGPDPTPEDNQARHADRLVYPDIVVTKSSAVEEVTPGDFVDFAITVGNVGAAPAAGVVVVDRVDTAVYAFVSASDGGLFDPAAGTVTWRLGELAPGAAPRALALTLAARFGVDPAIEIATNTVRADPDGTTGLDANPADNSATVVDRLLPGLDFGEIESLFGDDDDGEDDPEIETEAIPELAPLFTGRAPAGATVQVTLLGEGGAVLAQSTTLVGESGGWSLSMPGAEAGARALSAIVTTFPPPVRLQDAAPNAVFFGIAGDAPAPTARAYDLFDAREAESDRLRAERSDALQNPGRASARRYIEIDAVAGTGVNLT